MRAFFLVAAGHWLESPSQSEAKFIPDAELPQQARTIEGADEIPENDACAVLSQQLAASRKHFLSCLTRYSAPEYDFCFPKSRRSIYVFSTFREVSKGMQATMEKKRLEQ